MLPALRIFSIITKKTQNWCENKINTIMIVSSAVRENSPSLVNNNYPTSEILDAAWFAAAARKNWSWKLSAFSRHVRDLVTVAIRVCARRRRNLYGKTGRATSSFEGPKHNNIWRLVCILLFLDLRVLSDRPATPTTRLFKSGLLETTHLGLRVLPSPSHFTSLFFFFFHFICLIQCVIRPLRGKGK